MALRAGGGGAVRDGRLMAKILLRMLEDEFVFWGVNNVPNSILFSTIFIEQLHEGLELTFVSIISDNSGEPRYGSQLRRNIWKKAPGAVNIWKEGCIGKS